MKSLSRCLAPLALLIFLLVSSVAYPQTSPYRLSEEFKLNAYQDSSDYQYLRLDDGRSLAFGNFQLLDGQFIGAVAVLEADGSFAPLVENFPLLEVEDLKHAKNSDGGFSLLAQVASVSNPDLAAYVLEFSHSRQLESVLALVDVPVALLPDNRIPVIESRRRQVGNQIVYSEVIRQFFFQYKR